MKKNILPLFLSCLLLSCGQQASGNGHCKLRVDQGSQFQGNLANAGQPIKNQDIYNTIVSKTGDCVDVYDEDSLLTILYIKPEYIKTYQGGFIVLFDVTNRYHINVVVTIDGEMNIGKTYLY